MTRPLAVIIGAGVAGLAAAWWLDRAGWRSLIVERSSSLREKGYMLGLSGLGFETAGRMGLHDALDACSYAIDENVYKDSAGRELLRLRYRDFIRDLPFMAVRRSDLVRVLFEALPETASVRFETIVSGFQDCGDHVSVTLSNGETIKADLLIGADGFRSKTRQQLFGPDDACLAPLGYSFAVYDVDAPRSFESDFLSYAEPGHLAEYYVLHDGQLAAMHVWRNEMAEAERGEAGFEQLARVCRKSHPEVRAILERAETTGAAPMIDTLTMVELPEWSKGRVLLLGDAAHCLTLVSGQGAGMALASAEMLGNALTTSPDLASAIEKHEAALRPIIIRLQARSRKMASVFIPRGKFAFHLRNAVMRHMPRAWLGRYFTSAIKAEIALARTDGKA
ncbi:FAD-dependent monooxygenase [Martelella soudanensis]|uniref:FAD-dependent monooxygenase n=1 Tax=unclassified Martelella TaxID=2629616 RepID=UPI0015DF29CB|nr:MULTISPECIES: FAD-dependent monooxygenase [unclassified Martelella]